MKKLEKNHSAEPFGDLNMLDKLDLLKVLCDELLMSDEFSSAIKRIECRLVDLKDEISQELLALAEKKEMTLHKFVASEQKYFKEIQESKLEFFKIFVLKYSHHH